MYEKEKLIKEERTREATTNGLMGLDGKLGCILRNLGHPIISETSGWFESNLGEDFHGHLFDDQSDNEQIGKPIDGGNDEVDDAGWRGSSQEFVGVKKMDGDDIARKIGWHFDGLSRGMHLEIKYISERHELNATWEGHSVYTEISGELVQYVPGDWERCINRLFGIARKIQEKTYKEGVEETKVEIEKEKLGFLDTLKKLWGA